MANSAWSEKILQLLRRMNNFHLPGSCRPHCFRFEINEAQKYSVMSKFSDPPLMWMERAATSLFGVKRYGVHINGYTVSEAGEVSMWLARRSPTKQTYPGLLDNVAAGGLAAGVGIKHTLVKECQEEARIPAAIAEKAHPVTTVSYTYEEEDGVFAEIQFVFDLELPREFKPRVGDGEVQEFYLLPIDKVKELLATEDFKPNCAMVVLDFLIRHSFIEPDAEPCYQEFVAGLHQTLE
ncbi:hypothetical protein PFLUV_G00063430 [Perca fluviatilis]|uniref:Nudix hydrolase domain-containing protein n=1 Tax=Perca fluviatilis TaxID=8168 RepID=A0A6A5ENV1_PERFL|nr:hypothetical protein PFLUV_G00063430 [Perca fluviatilis]